MKKEKIKHSKKKWEELGLLESVKDKDKAAITKLYNKALEIGIVRECNQKPFDTSILLFPAIIRIYHACKITKINIEKLYDDLENHIKKFRTEMLEMGAMGIDWEAESLWMFTEIYKEKINKLKENNK